ncbi:probable glutathione S-transferase [Prosopis cineraria]|uniref:probable glutathione S-transferase n=1 Tax=Prosopis cineraria TaxID=364024 RepID=UPI0024105986|nr:probable glutathione S-transferase [Prosopis cineraria]
MAGKEEVKLLGIVGSPFASRAEIALKLKEVEYEYVHESVNKKSDLLLKYNPVHKLVPVLIHNEKPICESLVIVEYIDETWNNNGHPFLPSDPHQKALARFWSKFIDDKVTPAVFKAAWNPNEKEREKCVEESMDALKALENEVKGKFFNGGSIGLVDIAGLFVAYWLPVVQEAGGLGWFNGEKFPKLEKWSYEILNHPTIKLALPPRDDLLAYAKTQFQIIHASK